MVATTSAVGLVAVLPAVAAVAAAIADTAATLATAEVADTIEPAADIHLGSGLFDYNTEPTARFDFGAADKTLVIYSVHLGRLEH